LLDFLTQKKREYLETFPFFKQFLAGKLDDKTFIADLKQFFQTDDFEQNLVKNGFTESDIQRLKLVSEGGFNRFIIVEGSDASGKTSTANLLRKKVKAAIVNFPQDFWNRPKGASANEFYSQRIRESSILILKSLKKGDVISARYGYSIPAFAYTYSRGKLKIPPPEGILEPDIIIYVTASSEEIDKRIKERAQKGEEIPEHEADPLLRSLMRQRYDELFTGDPRVIIVDNTGSKVEDVVKELVRKIKSIQ
jgi:thymidylate kinase